MEKTYRPTNVELDALNAELASLGQEPTTADEQEAAQLLRAWEEGALTEGQALTAASTEAAREDLRDSLAGMKALREAYPPRVKQATVDRLFAEIQRQRAEKHR